MARADAAAAPQARRGFSRHLMLLTPDRPVAPPLAVVEPPPTTIDLGTVVLVRLRRGEVEGVVTGLRPADVAAEGRVAGPLFYVVQTSTERLLCQLSEMVVVSL